MTQDGQAVLARTDEGWAVTDMMRGVDSSAMTAGTAAYAHLPSLYHRIYRGGGWTKAIQERHDTYFSTHPA